MLLPGKVFTDRKLNKMKRQMLKDLNGDQVRFIALLARTARSQRDALLGNVGEADLGGTNPQRGEHNPSAELGFAPLLPGAPQTKALREAIASLSEPARHELYALMRIGQGHLTAKTWRRGLSEAGMLGKQAVTGEIIDDPDLHDHLSKGLYEAGLSS